MTQEQANEILKRRPLTKWEKIALKNAPKPKPPPAVERLAEQVAAAPVEALEAAHKASGAALMQRQLSELELFEAKLGRKAEPEEIDAENERRVRAWERQQAEVLAQTQARIDFWESQRRFAAQAEREMRERLADASCGLAIWDGGETMAQLVARQERGWRK